MATRAVFLLHTLSDLVCFNKAFLFYGEFNGDDRCKFYTNFLKSDTKKFPSHKSKEMPFSTQSFFRPFAWLTPLLLDDREKKTQKLFLDIWTRIQILSPEMTVNSNLGFHKFSKAFFARSFLLLFRTTYWERCEKLPFYWNPPPFLYLFSYTTTMTFIFIEFVNKRSPIVARVKVTIVCIIYLNIKQAEEKTSFKISIKIDMSHPMKVECWGGGENYHMEIIFFGILSHTLCHSQ